ncbi:Glycosyltransferase involved in cell wall bisynthesis [Algoriphagus alkaliphilus]|uniref:Glycosyltransferase involved in cell wall bisynthesis n=1 Tax=Algoriphagus alkaliphilus TaxID=279824 RepID=A0A1G5ZPA8_9BACT|nr:glycosyltransferase [Algoriphagus alkaliphilus]SDA96356.1 Glycosyltransferase involved in cell wall bisynthesis [Algoriphagus alkaliphilus]
MPRISIVMPCFNSELYLQETLDCLIKQSFTDWECVIVNNGSTDSTNEIANTYAQKDPRFRVLTKEHGGISSGRNYGIMAAKGEFIQLLDSDDLITPNKLFNEIEFLNHHPDVDIVYSGARYFYTNDHERALHVYSDKGWTGTIEIDRSDKVVLDAIMKRNPFVTSAPLYRASIFKEIGLYDESLQYIEDWDFQIRCALADKVFHYLGYKPDQCTLIRLHDRNISKNKDAVQSAKRKLMEKHAVLFKMKKKERRKISFKDLIPPILLSLVNRLR